MDKILAKKALILWDLNDEKKITDFVIIDIEKGNLPEYSKYECSGGACRIDWLHEDIGTLFTHLLRIVMLYPFDNSSVLNKGLREIAKIEELGSYILWLFPELGEGKSVKPTSQA